jgi:GNAT superfamily N-acetyltransferase
MRIQELDPADLATVDEVADLWEAAQLVDLPEDPKFAREWERGRILYPMPGDNGEWWLAWDGDDLAGVLNVALPDLDNVATALVDIHVHPDRRRRRIGAELFGTARERAALHGRKLMIAESPTGGPAEAFLRKLGFEQGLRDERRRLVIPPDAPGCWDDLLAEARTHAGGYSAVRWGNVVPEEYVDGVAYLTHRMSTDIPLDDLQWEPEAWDAERIRAFDRVLALRGGRSYTTAVIHDESGHVAGYTNLAYAGDDPTHAWQWNTIVEPAHRGHRLGIVLKLENVNYALAHEPATRTVITWNAGSNEHMIAINEAMGFRLLDEWCEWQLRRDG